MSHALLNSASRPRFNPELFSDKPAARKLRLELVIHGAVQGVGFRPFVFRLAETLRLTGWVGNSPQGVFIEAEGEPAALETFLLRLKTEKPPASFIESLETRWLDAVGHTTFEIRASENTGDKSALVLPDLATCPDCLRDIFDPANRRYRYPFTNCTHCGPRFSLIEALPYDRANTAMKIFPMCPACQAEYDDPRDRRFHAQPNACPVCGPRLELWSVTGEAVFGGDDALRAAARFIRRGKIVAVKGIGGFHLLADARNEKTVRRLRERKRREEKPFALMFPSLAGVKAVCDVSPLEENLLRSPAAPIVLLKKIANRQSPIGNSVAPGNPCFGVMLPSNPLQHLLMLDLDFPVVATSGNLSDEPICADEREALARLRGIADFFLVHNRPIVRHVDDSIVRVVLGREMILRRARGYAPLPVRLPIEDGVGAPEKSEIILAVGAHLKNAVALAIGENVFLSQHLGDLATEAAHQAFLRAAADLPNFYGVTPTTIAADGHPDYLSTKFALARRSPIRRAANNSGQRGGSESSTPQILQVQHHVAHALSCLAENEVELPALGLAWDGTGYGADGTIWGSECFLVTDEKVERIAHLRPFRLPGGEAAVKEPRRAALGLLYELFGETIFEHADLPPLAAFNENERAQMRVMLRRGFNAPLTSSAGRLFDAVAALAGLRQQTRFEGQAAMELEFALAGVATDERYDLPLEAGCPPLILDWSPLMAALLFDLKRGVSVGMISAKFHNTLAEAVVAVAREFGEPRVALSGGCFQNRYLLERCVTRLRAEKFTPYWHQRVPPSDGGIALGQIVAARRARKNPAVENRKS